MGKIKRVSVIVHFPSEGLDIESFHHEADRALGRFGARNFVSAEVSDGVTVIENYWEFEYSDGVAAGDDVLFRVLTYFEIHGYRGEVRLLAAGKNQFEKSRGYAVDKGSIAGEYRLGWMSPGNPLVTD